MHFTRRLLDRRPSGALVIVSCLVSAGVAWSCSSDSEDNPPIDPGDAASDATPQPGDAADEDARPFKDAAPIDASPLPIVCTSGPCAKAIVTTHGAFNPDTPNRAEGFCVLMNDGTVNCWGANESGQLGRADEPGSLDSAEPKRVAGLSDIVSLEHTCAVDKDGQAFCWGSGPYLQNEAESITSERTPVKLPLSSVTKVAVSGLTACALTGGKVVCWGSNKDGQVAPFDTWSPHDVALSPQPVALAAGSPIRDLVMGRATFVIREDGTSESWGANPPLGRRSPLFPDAYPQAIPISGVDSIDVTNDNACATAGGFGFCWGSLVTRLSDWPLNVPIIRNALPGYVAMPEPVVQIASTTNHVNYDFGSPIVQPQRWCAVAPSGNVYCWGWNASGQAGDGTKNHAYEAVKVTGLPAPAAQVKTTPDATCAVLTNGKVYCWGSNFYGQLGNKRIKLPSIVPQEVVLP